MDKREAFQIETVDTVGEDGTQWRAVGRALEHLQVGDLLFYDVGKAMSDAERLAFRVERIRIFNTAVPELDPGWAGELIFRGQRGNQLRPRTNMYVL